MNIINRKHDYELDLITKYVLSGSRWEDERRRQNKDGPSNGVQQPALQTTVCHSTRLGRRTSRGEEDVQSRLALPKNLIRSLPVQDHRSERFWRSALPFASACRCSGRSKLRRRHSSEERQNPNSIRLCFGRGGRVKYIEEADLVS